MRKGSTDAERMDFNRRLYAPGGYQLGPVPPVTPVTTPNINAGGGFMTGNPLAIQNQYQTPGTFASSTGMPTPLGTPMQGGFPVAGAAGPTGPTGPGMSHSHTSPGSADAGGFGQDVMVHSYEGEAGTTPPANSLQQHQQEAATPSDLRPISSARRFFWGTGLVDARAPLSSRSAPTDFGATFGAGATHMGSVGTTWDERQAQNQQHIADASNQRGLDWSPY